MFSTNYTLYGDLSDWVIPTMSSFVPRIEIDTINEAILEMTQLKAHHNLSELGSQIKKIVLQQISISVSVRIAPTKMLAKIVNKGSQKAGVFWARDDAVIGKILAFTHIEHVWGSGNQYIGRVG